MSTTYNNIDIDIDDDGVCQGEDPDDNDACVPSNNHPNCTTGSNCVEIDNDDFENWWLLWNDGGSDCVLSSAFPQFAYSGTSCVRLRDNTSSSVMTTDDLDLSAAYEVEISFTYIAESMENNEDFWLQMSTDGGSSYTTIADYDSGDEFVNGVREFSTITTTGPFSSTTRFRFRCDASANNDKIYIDDVVISDCSNSNLIQSSEGVEALGRSAAVHGENSIHVYPNPLSKQHKLFVKISPKLEFESLSLFTFEGKRVKQLDYSAKEIYEISVDDCLEGTYLLRLQTGTEIIQKRIVITR